LNAGNHERNSMKGNIWKSLLRISITGYILLGVIHLLIFISIAIPHYFAHIPVKNMLSLYLPLLCSIPLLIIGIGMRKGDIIFKILSLLSVVYLPIFLSMSTILAYAGIIIVVVMIISTIATWKST
jgi:hypothetical protein